MTAWKGGGGCVALRRWAPANCFSNVRGRRQGDHVYGAVASLAVALYRLTAGVAGSHAAAMGGSHARGAIPGGGVPKLFDRVQDAGQKKAPARSASRTPSRPTSSSASCKGRSSPRASATGAESSRSTTRSARTSRSPTCSSCSPEGRRDHLLSARPEGDDAGAEAGPAAGRAGDRDRRELRQHEEVPLITTQVWQSRDTQAYLQARR